MEDLAEVITAAEFHPTDCSSLVNSRVTNELFNCFFRSTVHQKEPFVFVICAIGPFVIIMLNVSVYLVTIMKIIINLQSLKSPRNQTAEVSSQKLLERFRTSSSVIPGDIFCHVII